ncbi:MULTISPECIES: flagellar motor protein MotP [Rossellomorea]|uniref:flagellar motor protein MotP n=1 Tax=Rossellomorea TaxID=2837508 RepID=UPI001CCF1B7E|nr:MULTISPECIES: flagellar motor protein MotP [Rossellomorea]MCA0150973.1 flagellar motor protein MotP [Rossellomorea vietnamensis]UTE76922.1 flagellar motor protein MotP [Rossellomorea sp. KS-H15a]WGG44836.1 flagellar motor protein MotP [Rossellomorea sp. DA94]
MKKLDVLTPIGVVVGFLFVAFAIISNAGVTGFSSFIDLPSIFVVIGGLIAAMLVSFSIRELKQLGKVMRESFRDVEYDLHDLIRTFVILSEKARREGLLSLEAEVEAVEDPFIRKGVLLAVDGIEQDVIVDIMNAEIIALEERHRKNKSLLDKAGEYAPAWGMIGTLIGLVLMLKNLNDPASLGPNMAIALLTTLYGSLLANLVFLPMASKLAMKTEKEVFMKQIVIEGVIGVQSGQNPKILEEKLRVFLSNEELQMYTDRKQEGAASDEA